MRGFRRSSGIIDLSLSLRFVDVGLGDDDQLVLRLQRNGGGGFFLEDAGDDAAVGGADDGGLIFLGHDGAGVEDVGEEVVEVGPLGAGDVGADFAAGAEEGVALLAGFGEDRAAEFEGRCSGLGARGSAAMQQAFVVFDELRFSAGEVRTMPQTCSMRLLRASSLRLRRLVTRSAVRWLAGTLPAATASRRAMA